MKFESGFNNSNDDSESTDSSLDDAEQIAAEKIVDLYSEEDLKYRDMNLPSLFATLEFGVVNDFNRGQFDDEKSLAEKIAEKRVVNNTVKSQQEGGYNFRRSHDDEYNPAESVGVNRGNVFYPEGILHVMRGIMRGDLPDNLANDDYDLMFIKGAFSRARRVLKERGANLFSLENESLYRQFLRSKEGEVIQSDREELTRDFDANYENFRREWLKLFFEEAQREDDSLNVIAPGRYHPSVGLIFDKNTDVIITGHGDYPTEAVITKLNNKRNICGIFINTNKLIGEKPVLRIEEDTRVRHEEYLKNKTVDIRSLSDLNKYIESVPEEVCSKIKSAVGFPEEWKEGEEETKQLENVMHNLGIENGESYWDVIINLGKKFKIPVYDLEGNVLWPEVRVEQ